MNKTSESIGKILEAIKKLMDFLDKSDLESKLDKTLVDSILSAQDEIAKAIAEYALASTKESERRLFAAMMLKGLLSRSDLSHLSKEDLTDRAIAHADLLIQWLDGDEFEAISSVTVKQVGEEDSLRERLSKLNKPRT